MHENYFSKHNNLVYSSSQYCLNNYQLRTVQINYIFLISNYKKYIIFYYLLVLLIGLPLPLADLGYQLFKEGLCILVHNLEKHYFKLFSQVQKQLQKQVEKVAKQTERVAKQTEKVEKNSWNKLQYRQKSCKTDGNSCEKQVETVSKTHHVLKRVTEDHFW